VAPGVPAALPQNEEQTTGQLIKVHNVNTLPLNKMLRVVVMVVEQIMTEFNGTVREG
jgi:hypothetical protein